MAPPTLQEHGCVPRALLHILNLTVHQHFGTPTDGERRAFTRVLQGHIAFDMAIFPNGTTGKWLFMY
jgi:hypothetical protein